MLNYDTTIMTNKLYYYMRRCDWRYCETRNQGRLVARRSYCYRCENMVRKLAARWEKRQTETRCCSRSPGRSRCFQAFQWVISRQFWGRRLSTRSSSRLYHLPRWLNHRPVIFTYLAESETMDGTLFCWPVSVFVIYFVYNQSVARLQPTAQRKLNRTQLNSTELDRSVQFSFPLCIEPATSCDDRWRQSQVLSRLWRNCDDHQFRRGSSRIVVRSMHSGKLNWTELNSSVEFSSVFRCEFGLGLRTADNMTLFISKIRENGHRHEIFKIDRHGCEIMPLLGLSYTNKRCSCR